MPYLSSITSEDFETACPKCDNRILVCCEAEPADPSVGIHLPSYSGMVREQECGCKLTREQVNAIAEYYYEDLLNHLY